MNYSLHSSSIMLPTISELWPGLWGTLTSTECCSPELGADFKVVLFFCSPLLLKQSAKLAQNVAVVYAKQTFAHSRSKLWNIYMDWSWYFTKVIVHDITKLHCCDKEDYLTRTMSPIPLGPIPQSSDYCLLPSIEITGNSLPLLRPFLSHNCAVENDYRLQECKNFPNSNSHFIKVMEWNREWECHNSPWK